VRRDRQPTYIPTGDWAPLTPSPRERHCAQLDALRGWWRDERFDR
jgi:hypothetical protein